MIDCCDFLDRYSDFRDQLLDESDNAAFEQHVALCESCSRYDRVVAGGIRTLLRVPDVTPSPDFADRLGDRLSGLDDELDGGSSNAAPVALVIAVAAAIAATTLLPTVRGEPQATRLPPAFAHAPYHPQLVPVATRSNLFAMPADYSPAGTQRAPGFAAYSLLGTPTAQAPARVARVAR